MYRVLVVVALFGSGAAACGNDASPGDADGRVAVVASFYPVAFVVERVGGGLVVVENLTPAGVEPHDLELGSDEVDAIESADAVFYLGDGFQPAVEAAAERRGDGAVDLGEGLVRGADAHFWLDPTLLAGTVERIEGALAHADPEHAATFAANAAALQADLDALDDEFTSSLSSCARRTIVTAHAAFGYLAERYGLEQQAISGVEPGSEPEPGRLADLADLIQRVGVTTVFYEELVPKDFAATLAREAGVRTAVLDPLEGLSTDDAAAGETYLTVMRRNLTALRAALDCRPPTAAA